MQMASGFLVTTGAIPRPRPRVGHIKLRKHVAGRQGHTREVPGVPRREDDATVVWRVSQLVNDVGQLVYTLAGVVGLEINIVGPKMSPLEAIHWT